MCGIDFVSPLQGLIFCCDETQGVAPGYHVIALSARGVTGLQFSANAEASLLFAEIPRRAKIFSAESKINL